MTNQQQDFPFYDSPEQAMGALVAQLGGAKKVGHALFPDKSVDAAGRYLHDCLNVDRPEKLTLSQWLLILRMAREAGFHGGMQWLAAEAGYDAIPVSPREEADRLTLVIEQSTKTLSAALATMERLRRGPV